MILAKYQPHMWRRGHSTQNGRSSYRTWLWIHAGPAKTEKVFGFCAAEVRSCGDVFPRPSLGTGRGKEFGDECDTFVLDADEDVREEEMEFENAEQ